MQLSDNHRAGQVQPELVQPGGSGPDYLPGDHLSTSTPDAQEARRSDPADRPAPPAGRCGGRLSDELRLYELIWKRTVASQMESAVLDQVAVDIASADGKAVFRATGWVVMFDGFLRVYQEEHDDSVDEKTAAEEDAEARLPPQVKEGNQINRDAIDAEQRFTQPPPRYTEAVSSSWKSWASAGLRLYASVVGVPQDRDYVEIDKRRFRAA